MDNSVLKVSLWLTRSCPQLFKYSQGFGVWLHSCWSWWRLKCFQSCCCWEHLSSLSKCQPGTKCFPWDHSLSWTKAMGLALRGTAENPCAALAKGNGCCCLLQIPPPIPERISAALARALQVRGLVTVHLYLRSFNFGMLFSIFFFFFNLAEFIV